MEEKVAKEGIVLTESQLVVFERRKAEKEAHGEIETEHPGYLGSQDTFMWERSREWDAFINKPL